MFIIDAAQPSAGWRMSQQCQQWKKVSFWFLSVRIVLLGSLCCCLVVPAFFPACFNLESQQLEENADWAWCRLEDPGPKAASQCIRIYPSGIFSSMCCMKMSWKADFAGGSHRRMAASQCVDCGAWFGAPSVAAMALGVVTRVGTACNHSSITKVMRPTRSCGAEGMEHGEHDRKCVENCSTTCTQESRNWE